MKISEENENRFVLYPLWSALFTLSLVRVILTHLSVAARQRRKSGDDVLNAAVKEKEKKKEASPGFFDYIGRRPRSKSDASRVGKKPTFMTSVKNAVQVGWFILSILNILKRCCFILQFFFPNSQLSLWIAFCILNSVCTEKSNIKHQMVHQ